MDAPRFKLEQCTGLKDKNGADLSNVKSNAAQFKSAISHASGPTVIVRDTSGSEHEIYTSTATDQVIDDLTDSQIDNWQHGIHKGLATGDNSSSWDTAIGQGGKLKADYDDVMSATRGSKDS